MGLGDGSGAVVDDYDSVAEQWSKRVQTRRRNAVVVGLWQEYTGC